MYRTILVPLDGSPLAERALPYARALASATGARLVLVRAVWAAGAAGTDAAQRTVQAVREAELYLKGVGRRLADRGLAVETATPYYWPDYWPAEAILAEIALRQADLVVMTTHGRSGLGRWIYGSVADQIMRRAEVPVLVVPATGERAWIEDRPLRMLVPLDGSDVAREVLEPARALAEALGAEMHVLRVVEPPDFAYVSAYPYLDFDPEAELAEARRYLEEVAAGLLLAGRPVTVHALTGRAVSVITTLAYEQGIDVVAMGTHGYGGLARAVLGSVASGVLQRTTAPVLVVRPAAARHRLAPAGVAAARPEPASPPVEVALSVRELALIRQGLSRLRQEREEPPAGVLDELLSRLGQAESVASPPSVTPPTSVEAPPTPS